ncbi:hypothetical protein BU26DRAFT_522478 [Trematosphaeria pertusa]|uniref:Uncharacterized protein n=1 Tax=Trematosphaeria pertusa TaxID=390896 RepID=A0A6A6I521_9PLEO|nr:uncharacterized protein BU26DRAFT_522478 [Trematosphaeria pertusa]KAF2244680.1 hypothetical protein BU26DRAFT_522478 [Trematosphaeria pertusa]
MQTSDTEIIGINGVGETDIDSGVPVNTLSEAPEPAEQIYRAEGNDVGSTVADTIDLSRAAAAAINTSDFSAKNTQLGSESSVVEPEGSPDQHRELPNTVSPQAQRLLTKYRSWRRIAVLGTTRICLRILQRTLLMTLPISFQQSYHV